MTDRKPRKDTVAGAVQTMQQVQRDIMPTIELGLREMEHFKRVIHSREMSTWSELDIQLATILAQQLWQQDELMHGIKEEGSVVVNQKGTPVANPKFNAMLQLNGSINANIKTLGLSASQKGLGTQEQKARNDVDKKAIAVISQINDDVTSLLD